MPATSPTNFIFIDFFTLVKSLWRFETREARLLVQRNVLIDLQKKFSIYMRRNFYERVLWDLSDGLLLNVAVQQLALVFHIQELTSSITCFAFLANVILNC
jgi:hypothetical protein